MTAPSCTGRAFAIVGPSGAGKDTLIAALVAARPDLQIVRRVITRPESLGGEPFEGVTQGEFDLRRAAGAFALDWQAHGLSYGIPHSACAAVREGRTVLFNGSRAMLTQAARAFPGLHVLCISAPVEVLAERLAARGRETREDIAARLARAGAYPLPEGIPATVIDNGGALEAAVRQALAVLEPQAVPERG